MSEEEIGKNKKPVNTDWFVQGGLSRIGDIFDKMLGRGSGQTSKLAASELTERLKSLLDAEVEDLGEKGKFVPHNIKLKMQWNKFSTDSEESLKRLEYELLAAAVDHINDNLYHTYKPLKIEIKPDYFTEGIKFSASFDEFAEDDREAEINVSIPQMKTKDLIPQETALEVEAEVYIADFTIGEKRKTLELKFTETKKRISVGRTKENDLVIDDISISKIHAALVLNPEKKLLVADTGSTNGTFINDQRISYGRAFPIGEDDKLKFGTVEVYLRKVPKPTDFEGEESYSVELPKTEAFELESKPTEAFQLPPQKTEAVIIQESQNPIPQPIKTNNDEVINPTEPRIKLNFDE